MKTETGQLLSAIILAGGQSTRMGQDKALIPVNGMPLLQRVCQVALQCTPDVYVVTRSLARYQAIVPPTCHLMQEYQLPGEIAPQGPLVGFAQGLAQVHTDWVLLLACDLPNLNVQTLRAWAQECTCSQEAIALLPRHNSTTWEALCGFYRTTCLPALQVAIAQGERSFQRWLRFLTVKELLVPDPHMLLNCNAPKDLLKIRQVEADVAPEDEDRDDQAGITN